MLDDRTTQKLDRKIGGRPPRVQPAQPAGLGRATLHFPRFLCGYDEEELEARALASYAYDWRRR